MRALGRCTSCRSLLRPCHGHRPNPAPRARPPFTCSTLPVDRVSSARPRGSCPARHPCRQSHSGSAKPAGSGGQRGQGPTARDASGRCGPARQPQPSLTHKPLLPRRRSGVWGHRTPPSMLAIGGVGAPHPSFHGRARQGGRGPALTAPHARPGRSPCGSLGPLGVSV